MTVTVGTMSFDSWVFPPVAEPKEAFTAHSVRFMDQFGNKQTVRRVRFRSMAAAARLSSGARR